jgi:hypothetical protein
VTRGTNDIVADAPSPKNPRFNRRETGFTTADDPATIFAFYRAALPGLGWQFCSSLDHLITPIDYYTRSDDSCDRTGKTLLRVSIYISRGSPYDVLIIEDLPAPYSWPDPPAP